jgi:hypothetical protein
MNLSDMDLVELLVKHELALGALYEGFAEALAGHKQLWRTLAADEHGHAEMVETLRGDPAVNRWLLHGTGVKPFAVKSSIDYMDNIAARARAGGLSSLQALSIAKDMETSLIEEQFSKMSPALSEEVASLIAELVADTERHRRTIVEALEVERRGGI